MWLFGESINLMSMGGLAVAIGLVIDDAVVVVENIHRRLAEGGGTRVGRRRPRSELVAPIVGSTLTTVVVFAPLGLLSGVVGQFFKALSITLSVAVLISLVLALDADSAAGARCRTARHRPARRTTIERRGAASTASTCATLPAVPAAARSLVARDRAAAGRRRRWLAYLPRRHRLPAGGRRGRLRHRLPHAGRHGARGDRRSGCARSRRSSRDTPEVATLRPPHRLRAGPVRDAAEQRRHPGAPQAARRARSARPTRSSTDLRDKLGEAVPDTEIEFVQLLQDMLGDLEGNPTPIEVKIFGDDQEQLERAVARRSSRSSRRSTASSTSSASQRGSPEVTWHVDPVAAGRLGLTVEQVVDAAVATRGSATSRPSCACSTARFRCACAIPTRPASIRDRLAQTTVRGADGKLAPAVGARARSATRGGRAGAACARTCGRWRSSPRGSRTATSAAPSRRSRRCWPAMKLPVGYTLRSRRPVRVAAPGVPRAAARRRASRPRWSFVDSRRSSSARSRPPLLILRGGAAVARRRVRAAAR